MGHELNLDRAGWIKARDKLEALFLASFGRQIHPGYFDWRYLDNGHQQILFELEVAHGEPVASYSAFPVSLVCDGKLWQTAMSMTTMTHPSWRGRGLFQKLAEALYGRAATLKFSAVWGFPNTNSHPLFASKLGWSDIYEIPTMTLEVLKADSLKFNLSAAVESDDGFSLNYPEQPSDGLIRVHRSKDYLVWRYARNPVNKYRNYVIANDGLASSYVVTKSFGEDLDLVDIQIATPGEARTLLSHVVESSRGLGARRINCWAPTHHFVHFELERLGFGNSAPVTYFGGRDLISPSVPGLFDHKKWYFQMGDSDVY